MPIYEYACKACNHKFEQLVRTMSGKEKVKCPECGSGRTERELSVFAVGAEQPRSSGRPAGCEGCCGGTGACPMEE